MAVTAASLPPLAFNLSHARNKNSLQTRPGEKMVFFWFFHGLNTLLTNKIFRSHHRICHCPLTAVGTWINFIQKYFTFRTTHNHLDHLTVDLQPLALNAYFEKRRKRVGSAIRQKGANSGSIHIKK